MLPNCHAEPSFTCKCFILDADWCLGFATHDGAYAIYASQLKGSSWLCRVSSSTTGTAMSLYAGTGVVVHAPLQAATAC